uniref:Tail assembly chaperone protein n=1 Tax=Siphoviridae sp. ctiJI15 TaxID=2826431 RepID=A0A8S5NKF9_9CAUD|nr:MAG TPA: tail assembly chaperone protein [Siphoviridae sp. ctiJI15]
MIIETKNKTINLVLKIRKIVDIANLLNNKNFEEAFTKAYSILDPEALSKIIFKLAENEEGKSAFTSSNEVYNFMDDCRIEGITVNDLYGKIAEALNAEGFFKKKMNKKELKEMISNPLLTMNMNDLVQKSAESAMSKIAEQQFQEQRFQGYEA